MNEVVKSLATKYPSVLVLSVSDHDDKRQKGMRLSDTIIEWPCVYVFVISNETD